MVWSAAFFVTTMLSSAIIHPASRTVLLTWTGPFDSAFAGVELARVRGDSRYNPAYTCMLDFGGIDSPSVDTMRELQGLLRVAAALAVQAIACQVTATPLYAFTGALAGLIVFASMDAAINWRLTR